jgi:hypothetical protein
MLISGEPHLRAVLAGHTRHYNGRRPRVRQLIPPQRDHPTANPVTTGSSAGGSCET